MIEVVNYIINSWKELIENNVPFFYGRKNNYIIITNTKIDYIQGGIRNEKLLKLDI